MRHVVFGGRRIATLCVILLCGCGRLAFEQTNHDDSPWDGSALPDGSVRQDGSAALDGDLPIDGTLADTATGDGGTLYETCFEENFDDGNGDGWTLESGGVTWQSRAGQRSLGWGTTPESGAALTQNAGLMPMEVFELDLEVFLDNPTSGDLYVFLYSYTGSTYQYYIHPPGSDETTDVLNANGVTIASNPAGPLTAQAWHHVRLTRNAEGTFDLSVDGTSILRVTDTSYPPPYILDLGMFGGGVLDSIRFGCE